MNANQILFRCSKLGLIMTDAKSSLTEKQAVRLDDLFAKSELTKKQKEELERLIFKRDHPGLSETCKAHLVEVFVYHKYGRKKEVESRYTKKGLMVEEDALTLYSRYKKNELYFKNTKRFTNKFITGEPDITIGDEGIVIIDGEGNIKIVKDIKCSWDIFTFFETSYSSLNKIYYWQQQGYMDLLGAQYSVLAYCLINTPDVLINDEKRRLQFKMGVIDDVNETYIEACAELEKNMRYDDIPIEERVLELPIERNETDIKRIHERVEECRKYMNEYMFKVPEKILP